MQNSTGVLRDVQGVLNEHGVSLASFIIDALRDPKSLFAKDFIARITDVLGALRPHLDDRSITEFGRFFASIASSELLELGKDDMWHLPASKLSAGWLQEFSVKKMSEEISLMAPGLSSFLDSICAGKKTASSEASATDDDETDLAPDQLLRIVRLRVCHTYIIDSKDRKEQRSRTSSSMPATETAMRFRSQSACTCTQQTHQIR